MKITDLHVDCFGIWRDLDIAELSEQLTVFFGPNEAGKTTLLHFLRSMLYGFSPALSPLCAFAAGRGRPEQTARSHRWTSPHRDARGRFLARAHASPADANGESGKVQMTSEDGKHHGAHRLTSLLSGIDESIFNNVFALGLTELQQLGSLNDTQAAEQLYSLSTGVDRVSLADVMRELHGARDRLLPANGQAGAVTDLLSQRKRQESEIAKLSAQTEQWTRLRSRHSALADEISQLETERDQLAEHCG